MHRLGWFLQSQEGFAVLASWEEDPARAAGLFGKSSGILDLHRVRKQSCNPQCERQRHHFRLSWLLHHRLVEQVHLSPKQKGDPSGRGLQVEEGFVWELHEVLQDARGRVPHAQETHQGRREDPEDRVPDVQALAVFGRDVRQHHRERQLRQIEGVCQDQEAFHQQFEHQVPKGAEESALQSLHASRRQDHPEDAQTLHERSPPQRSALARHTPGLARPTPGTAPRSPPRPGSEARQAPGSARRALGQAATQGRSPAESKAGVACGQAGLEDGLEACRRLPSELEEVMVVLERDLAARPQAP
mmetsp:Transcript_53294/g.134647  ORF Transcript_53294/g.134647 Transcript_53294/m.134647 type:complete len:302 (-) Transcript_53294:115-1020(-)